MSQGNFRTLAVVGAGNMGSGIAQKMATEGFDVVLVDLDDEKVARGIATIARILGDGVARGIFKPDAVALILSRIRGTSRFEDLADVDLVVEAVFEDLAVKKDVFARLDRVVRPDAVLGTNTSSFSVTDVAGGTRHPERVVGLHYFFHPAKNRLVEVVPGTATDERYLRRAWALQELLGKTPIASRDASGFIVNRFFSPWLNEAVRLLEEGVGTPATIDAAAKLAFSIGMGPFELMNVTGIPIALHTADTLGRAFGPLYEAPPALRAKFQDGGLWDLSGEAEAARFDRIGDRLAGVAFFVAAALVDQGVGTMEDTDIGARVGLRWRRGPFELMNHYGIERAAALADTHARSWSVPVPDLLVRQARAAQPFRFTLVRSDVAGGIATLTINRPDAMNALNAAVVDQLRSAFHAAADDPAVTGIVIAGSGKAFVAGADIRFFVRNIESGHIDRIAAFTKEAQDLLLAIAQCPKPVVARVHGLALGGGVEMALACHAIVATPRASFAFPETGIGIYPGLGGTQRTTKRVGKGLAKWLVLTGQMLGADEALAIGLIDRVVPHEHLDAAVAAAIADRTMPAQRSAPPETHRAIADLFESHSVDALLTCPPEVADKRLASALRRLGSKAPIALRIASDLIDRGAGVPVEDGLRMELAHLEEIFATADAAEGLKSLGQRAPVFKGH